MTAPSTGTATKPGLGAATVVFAIAAAIAAIGLPYTIWQVFYGTPLEKELFFNQKIFYYHVPHALLLFVTVFVCGIASFGYLKTRKGSWDDVALAGGELSVLFGAVVLITGSVGAARRGACGGSGTCA